MIQLLALGNTTQRKLKLRSGTDRRVGVAFERGSSRASAFPYINHKGLQMRPARAYTNHAACYPPGQACQMPEAFPLRLHCCASLNEISRATGQYIPAPPLLEAPGGGVRIRSKRREGLEGMCTGVPSSLAFKLALALLAETSVVLES